MSCDAGTKCPCWQAGYVEGSFDFGNALARSGTVQNAALAERLLVEQRVAEAHLVTHPAPEQLPVKRWGE